jgi:hypothetical protein
MKITKTRHYNNIKFTNSTLRIVVLRCGDGDHYEAKGVFKVPLQLHAFSLCVLTLFTHANYYNLNSSKQKTNFILDK